MTSSRARRRSSASLSAFVGVLALGACGPRRPPGNAPEIRSPEAGALEPPSREAPAQPGAGAPGSLDPFFGAGGLVVGFPGTTGRGNLSAVAVDAARRVVAAGTVAPPGGHAELAVLRLTHDGRPDASFGNGGVAVVASPSPAFAQGLAIAPDGGLWVSGYQDGDALLVRLRPDGTPEPGFGVQGRVETDFGSRDDRGGQVLALADGGALTVGLRCDPCENTRVAHTHFGMVIARYAPDGQRLEQRHLDIGRGRDFPTRIARAPDGGTVIAGYTSSRQTGESRPYDLFAARLSPDLALDLGFGERGFAVLDLGWDEVAWALAVAPDGRLLVGGSSRRGSVTSPLVVRLTARGARDPSFGGGSGAVVLERAAGGLQLNGLHVLASGAIVGTGWMQDEELSPTSFVLVRLTAAGVLDRDAWPAGGILRPSAGRGDQYLQASTLDADGSLVFAGILVRETQDADFVLGRWWP